MPSSAAIEAAARAIHRFNAPRVANDVEPWEAVTPVTQARWMKQAELALRAAEEADVEAARALQADCKDGPIEGPLGGVFGRRER